MWFAEFLFFSIWFSDSVKNTSGFSGFDSQCGFWFFLFFSYLALFVYTVLYAVFGLADFVCGFAVLDEFFFGFAVSIIPQCPPRTAMWTFLSNCTGCAHYDLHSEWHSPAY